MGALTVANDDDRIILIFRAIIGFPFLAVGVYEFLIHQFILGMLFVVMMSLAFSVAPHRRLNQEQRIPA
jgi:hypothetical protein